jgi:tRNA(fMet)-specific endonuclease VapC
VKYLLDTDHISFLQRRSSSEFSQLTSRMLGHPFSDFALSVISFHEQVIGAHDFLDRNQKNNTDMARGYALLLETLNSFAKAPVLPFDTKAIAIFDEMRSQKVRVSTMDLRIGAIAISKNLILLTRNTGDFSKVPNLITEDWTV